MSFRDRDPYHIPPHLKDGCVLFAGQLEWGAGEDTYRRTWYVIALAAPYECGSTLNADGAEVYRRGGLPYGDTAKPCAPGVAAGDYYKSLWRRVEGEEAQRAVLEALMRLSRFLMEPTKEKR